MTQTRLDSLMLLFVEPEQTNTMHIDEVINEFKTLKDMIHKIVL